MRGTLVRSNKPLALLLTCSVSCLAAVSCNDDEDAVGGTTAGSSSGGMGGKSTAGSSNAGTAGKSTAGSSNGGTAGNGTAGTSTAGTAGTAGMGGAAMGGADTGGAAGEGGTAGGDAGAPTDGGMGGMGGEGGEPDVGPHQTPRLAYHFDENAGTVVGDSSGRDLDATLSQAAWTADGRNGPALKLAGGLPPTQYASVPPGIFDGAKATTIAAWVKLDANPMWARLFDFGNGQADPANRFMYLALDSNLAGKTGVRFVYYGGSPNSEPTAATGTVLPLNVWKHLAVTMAEDGEQAIYIDGFPAAHEQNTPVPLSGLEPLVADSWLGKSRFPDAGLQGAMDDFVVYDRVLSAKEIAVLADPKSDYSRLPFDEAQGTTSADVSDRAADAVLNGGATWTTGRLAAGVQLSGTNQYVTLTNPLAGCTSELSISLWVKYLEARPWSRIFDFGDAAKTRFIFLTPDTGTGFPRLSLVAPNVAETILIGTKAIPVENAWHHVAVVVTADLARLYIDGEAAGNAPNLVPPSALAASTDNWLGHSRFFPTDADLNGAFDEVRIMCRALTPDEVKNLAFKD